MKHSIFPSLNPPTHIPNPRSMTDEDWEQFVLKKEQEESDFFNATAPLTEKLNV